MISEYVFEKLLTGKRALVLSTGGDTLSEIGLKLALEGCSVLTLSPEKAEVAQLGREVRDVGGVFGFRIIDVMNDEQVRRTALDAFRDSGGVNVIVDDTANAHSRFWWNEYISSIIDNDGGLPLEHVIMVNRAIAIDDTAIDGIPLISLRDNPYDVHYTVITDGLYIDRKRAAGTSRTEPQSYSAMVAREVVHRLTQDAYQDVEFIALHGVGDDVFARLYILDEDGEFGEPEHEARRGRVLQTFVKMTENGRGVFASRDFARGDIVLETNGKGLNHQTEHSLQIGWGIHLEPDAPIRLMNHSCEPSAGVKTNARGLPDFYAFRDIRAGEEITFDYAMTEYTHYPRDDESLEFNLSCYCGNDTCRGRLGYYSELPDEIKLKYEGFVSDYLLE
jgi:hypothetical protein